MSVIDANGLHQPQEEGLATVHVLVMDNGYTPMSLSDSLIKQGYTATLTRQSEHALQVLRELHPSHVLLDIEEASEEEIRLIQESVQIGARVVVAGPAGADLLARQVMAQGAAEYLNKPVDTEKLWTSLEQKRTEAEPISERVHIDKESNAVYQCGMLYSRFGVMQEVIEQVQRVATTSVTVFIIGESGTGKELVAQAIHRKSERRNQPFVPVNCGAISPQLIESELFGHERGSFTGAIKEHHGVFERANGGTLFLDEITEMPIDLQIKLLRVLETQTFTRLGSDREKSTDVRIIAATNRCPEKEVQKGYLRADLLYRIQVFPIWLPPLREREGDVTILAEHFLAELNQADGQNKRFSAEALTALSEHCWPGNLRELKNVVQRAYILADQVITTQNFPREILGPTYPVRQKGPSLTVNIGTSVAEVERNLIFATLDQCDGKKEKAANILGVSVKTLYNRLREYEKSRFRHSDKPGDGL